MFLAGERARGATLSTLPDESGYVSFVAGGSAIHTIRTVAANLRLNVRLYFEDFAPHFNPSYPVGGIIFLAIIILAAIGAWRIGRRRLVLPLTVAASGGLTLCGPGQDRLLVPLLPFAGLLAAMTLQWIGELRELGNLSAPASSRSSHRARRTSRSRCARRHIRRIPRVRFRRTCRRRGICRTTVEC
jgi:hypothetical protein